jgi:predicted enzyme related to lactoylglutathione lyase
MVVSSLDAEPVRNRKEISVDEKGKMSPIGKPVPELPVADVERAQQHYRDALGFAIGWLYPDKGIGSVSRADMGPIFFRKRQPPFEAAIHWVFAEDIDASYQELQSLGANIVDPLEKKPGDYGNSPYRIWTATSSISTMTNQAAGVGNGHRAHTAFALCHPAR